MYTMCYFFSAYKRYVTIMEHLEHTKNTKKKILKKTAIPLFTVTILVYKDRWFIYDYMFYF